MSLPRLLKTGISSWILTCGRRVFCTREGACSGGGARTAHGRACASAHHGSADCSQCAPGYYTHSRNVGSGIDCLRCAGDERICAARGFCNDDQAERERERERETRDAGSDATAALKQGTGSCACSDAQFGGTVAAGRTSCILGSCPDGHAAGGNLKVTTRWCTVARLAPTEQHPRMAIPASRVHLAVLLDNKAVCACRARLAASFLHLQPRPVCRVCLDRFQILANLHALPVRWAASSQCKPWEALRFAITGAECSPCPAGTTSYEAQTSCIACMPGFVSLPNATKCTQCEAGYFRDGTKTECAACLPGSSSDAGRAKCTACPAGFVAGSDSRECKPCEVGRCASASHAECLPCVPGTFSKAGQSECIACSAGFVAGPERQPLPSLHSLACRHDFR